ncbi:hypothetical protein [Acetomicrobium sp.]|uniref:hypothetical protein n=1 Tax=Acetomicrobium sp. TaxID=1872099 RepID=UPI0028717640|nr:hypothetical protein [Acetomicrobium sp.]MDR9769430.1 hypothetical protein [Acetomicrobium sp.]
MKYKIGVIGLGYVGLPLAVAFAEKFSKEFPTVTGMHDWWIYLVISAFGKVIYDPVPKILYRQHSSNVIGHKKVLSLGGLKESIDF